MYTMIKNCGVALLVALFAVTAALGQTGRIQGTVLDPFGAPIVGAGVHLSDMNNVSFGSATTNGSGKYSFPALPDGYYKIYFNDSLVLIYLGDVTNIEVWGGQTTTLIPVTNTNQSGPGSITQAVTDANSTVGGMCHIHFLIGGIGTQTITFGGTAPSF